MNYSHTTYLLYFPMGTLCCGRSLAAAFTLEGIVLKGQGRTFACGEFHQGSFLT